MNVLINVGVIGYLPRKNDAQKVVDALIRYKEGKQKESDFILILDAISIMNGIKERLDK